MEQFFVPKIAAMKITAAVKAAILDGGECGLYTNDFFPDADTVIGDLTEANYTGYARAALATWSAPHLTPEKQAVSTAPLASFTTASPYTVGNICFGYFVTDTDGDLLAAGRFSDPIPMTAAGNFMQVLMQWIQGSQG